MRVISAVVMLVLSGHVFSQSIYSGTFDYKRLESATKYFAGRSKSEIDSYCKTDSLPTEEAGQCSHFYFERANAELSKRIAAVVAEVQKNDQSLMANGEPPALPYFNRAQKSWLSFRDNECYTDAYSVGQASMRFIDFWNCMTRITKNRLDELTKPDVDE